MVFFKKTHYLSIFANKIPDFTLIFLGSASFELRKGQNASGFQLFIFALSGPIQRAHFYFLG
jgi:hypothetical protein